MMLLLALSRQPKPICVSPMPGRGMGIRLMWTVQDKLTCSVAAFSCGTLSACG